MFKNIACGLVIFAMAALAGEHVYIQKVQVYAPNGAMNGRIVLFGDRMTYVDDSNPDLSFVVPRADVRKARWADGRLTIELARPYRANESSVALLMSDSAKPGRVVTWVGVPVEGLSNEASRMTAVPVETEITEVTFETNHGDHKGRLTLSANELRYDAMKDPSDSRRWAYSQIRDVGRDGNEVKVMPFDGKKYEFKFHNDLLRQTAYDMIRDRMEMARVGK